MNPEDILKTLKERDENIKLKNDVNNDTTWMMLFLALLGLQSSSSPNLMLEKEVSYLRGRLDTLEKLIIPKKNS